MSTRPGEVSTEELRAADAAELQHRPGRHRRGRLHRRRRAHAGGRRPPARLHAAGRSRRESVGRHLKRGAIVVYESTVYPGATEEVCIPILEKHSGLKWKQRLLRRLQPRAHQPGRQGAHAHQDRQGGVRRHARDAGARWRRSTARSSPPACYPASSIKVAEAAKVIENTQRDLNIALMNELSIIFDRIGIDTLEVLKAAGTKWNFLPFRPGPGRRALHRRRPVLPDAQGRDAGLPRRRSSWPGGASTTAWASTSPSRRSSR